MNQPAQQDFAGENKDFPFSRPGWMGLLLVLLTVCVYWPALHADFVDYDDAVYVLENSRVLAGLTWEGMGWAFRNLDAGFWQPLTWLSHMLDVQLFGLNPAGHHLTSVLLHAANAALLFLVWWQLTGSRWRSALVAALFALHPLHVEAVAWVAERKEVLSAFFGLLTLLFYARYVQQPRARDYGLALLFFVCGLMSKTMVVTLPVVMLLLDFWPLRRFERSTLDAQRPTIVRLVGEKLPFFAAALMCGWLTIHAEKEVGALAPTTAISLSQRIPNAICSYVKYLEQTILPAKLAVFYPLPNTFPIAVVALSGVFLLVVTLGAIGLARRRPYLAVGWFWFAMMLLPVSGLLQVGIHARADRYTYLPLIGVFVALAWGVGELIVRWPTPKVLIGVLAALVLAGCVGQTRVQLSYWQTDEKLFRHAVTVTENNALAYNNLGDALGRRGRFQEALTCFFKVLEINPDDAEALDNVGLALAMSGKLDEAIDYLEKSLQQKPDNPKAHSNLGNALAAKRNYPVAIAHYEAALRCAALPRYQAVSHTGINFAVVHFNLGRVLVESGKPDEAVAHFRETLRLRPDFTDAAEQLRVLGVTTTNEPAARLK